MRFTRLTTWVFGALMAGSVSAQSGEGDDTALVQIKAMTAFDLACLQNAPEFRAGAAGFAASGWIQVKPGQFIGEEGRVIALIQSQNDDTFRVCAIAVREADVPSLLDGVPGLIEAAWQDSGAVAIEVSPEGPVFLTSELVVGEVHFAAEVRDQGNGITTLSVSAAAADGVTSCLTMSRRRPVVA